MLQVPDHRRLLEFCIHKGYLNSVYKPLYKAKFYYLTQKGKDFIKDIGNFVQNYSFEERQIGGYSFAHKSLLIDAYFLLHKYWDIQDCINEWVLRIGRHKREKFPDAIMLLGSQTKIAIEAELDYKCTEAWKTVVARYDYDITRQSYVHGVLIVTDKLYIYNGIRKRLFNIYPEFSNKAFILTNLEILKTGKCLYQGKEMNLTEAVKTLENRRCENG